MDPRTQLARLIYNILVQVGGGNEISWPEFSAWFLGDPDERGLEFRFIGEFGMGGKFWRNDGRFYVNYYPDNKTVRRKHLAVEINELLDGIVTGPLQRDVEAYAAAKDKALSRYGDHLEDCRAFEGGGHCTCGLDEAVDAKMPVAPRHRLQTFQLIDWKKPS